MTPHPRQPKAKAPSAKLALQGHLERVEFNLKANRTPPAERDETLAAIAGQFNDHLGKPYDEANQAEADAALEKLAPPDSYLESDEASLGELLRRVGAKLIPGPISVPVAIKGEDGRAKILWGILLTRLGIMAAVFVPTVFITRSYLTPSQPFGDWISLMFYSYMLLCIFGGVIWKIRSTPTDQLPRASEVQALSYRVSGVQFGLVFMLGSVLMIISCTLAYIVFGLATGKPIWPYSPKLFGTMFLPMSYLWLGVVFIIYLRQRRRQRSIKDLL